MFSVGRGDLGSRELVKRFVISEDALSYKHIENKINRGINKLAKPNFTFQDLSKKLYYELYPIILY